MQDASQARRRLAVTDDTLRERHDPIPLPCAMMASTIPAPGLTLATFASQLRFDAIPVGVVARTVDLYVDWLGSAPLASKGAWS